MKTYSRGPQRGVTALMVLIMMTVMLLGSLALARMTETATLTTGNVAGKEASIHAAEVGWNTAFAAVKALGNEDTNAAGWYWASMQARDANGIPTITWTSAPEVTVGRYSVRYVVERMCNVAPITASTRQCLVKLVDVLEDRGSDEMDYVPHSSRQFRITVRTTDAKGTQTWVQSMATKGG